MRVFNYKTKIGNFNSSVASPFEGSNQPDFKFRDVGHYEEVKKFSFYAEINILSKATGKTQWAKYFPSVTQITVQKCKIVSDYFIRFCIGKEIVDTGIEIPLPISRLKKTSECFIQWRDKINGGAWGLNFISEKDVKRFLRLCVISTPEAPVKKSRGSSANPDNSTVKSTTIDQQIHPTKTRTRTRTRSSESSQSLDSSTFDQSKKNRQGSWSSSHSGGVNTVSFKSNGTSGGVQPNCSGDFEYSDCGNLDGLHQNSGDDASIFDKGSSGSINSLARGGVGSIIDKLEGIDFNLNSGKLNSRNKNSFGSCGNIARSEGGGATTFDQKPSIRQPLVPTLRKATSFDQGLKNLNSFDLCPVASQAATSPGISSSILSSGSAFIPCGYDSTEYEFLTGQNNIEDHKNNENEDLGLGASALSNSGGLFIPSNSNNQEDNLSCVSEDFQDTRPPSAVNLTRQMMTTRKASWLLVKSTLVHSKKGKLELSTSRKWRKYWVTLKGVELSLYQTDDKVTDDQIDDPAYQLHIDSCLVQSVPEYTRLENVFSLSTKHGNAYYLQATSQTEVENWIHCINTSAGAALARKKGQENIAELLIEEIKKLQDKMQSDEKLRKMAVLQLKIEKEQHIRQNIIDQIISWEESLELLHSNIFRLSCYLAAIESTQPPSPQDLLTHVSRNTKQALSKIGLFSVTSFQSYVNTKNAVILPSSVCEEKRRRNVKMKPNGIKARLLNSLKIADDNVVSAIRSKHSNQSRNKRSTLADSSDNDSTTSSSKTSLSKRLSDQQKFQGRVGNTLYIHLPNNRTCALPYEPNLKISDLMERICMKERFDSMDYFLMLMTDDNKKHGLLDYTIPKEKTLLDMFQYSSIKFCPKLLYDVKLSNPADYEHGAFGLEIIQSPEERILVTFVEDGSPARKSGIVVDDEVVEINGQTLRELNNCFNDIMEVMNTSSSIHLKLRSKRIDDPKKTFQTTESMISFLVCPPPPKSMQPDLSDDLLNTWIVPAPTDFEGEDGEASVSTASRSFNHCNGEANKEDIDQFLKKTEQVNMMTREMNAIPIDHPPVAPSMKPGVKLRKAIIELIDTEKTYVKNLKILLERYLVPLKEEDFLSKDEAELLVTNVREIYSFQTKFLERLKEIVKNEKGFETFTEAAEYQNTVYSVGELFLEYVDKFKLYSTFCSCHSRAVKLLELNSNDALRAFLIARNPKQQHTGTIESYLITPIQRILRYPLLMKTMLKMLHEESDEYSCLRNALKSVEKVADFINEMQRISETYTPIFQELCIRFDGIEKNDMDVDNLLHYGRVQWINYCEILTSRRDSASSTPNLSSYQQQTSNVAVNSNNNNQESENLTIFIFKKAVVLIIYEPKTKKKLNSSQNLKSSGNGLKDFSDIKFHVIIPIWHLLLRDHAWSENDTNQVWEIVDTTSEMEDEHLAYMFLNRTGEEKKVFVNAIKESRKINKLSSSTALLGMRPQHRHSKSGSLKRSNSINRRPHSMGDQDKQINIVKDTEMSKKPTVKKKPSFTNRNGQRSLSVSSSSGLPSPRLSRLKLFGKS